MQVELERTDVWICSSESSLSFFQGRYDGARSFFTVIHFGNIVHRMIINNLDEMRSDAGERAHEALNDLECVG